MSQLTVVRFKITIATHVRNSAEQDVRAWKILGFQMPTAWDAADLGFLARPILPREDPGNDVPQQVLDDNASAVVVKVAASKYVTLNTDKTRFALMAAGGLTLVSSADQTADREILAVCARLDD